MKPENNFKFLNYEFLKLYKDEEVNVFIYKCGNYPLCNIDIDEKNIQNLENCFQFIRTIFL